MKKEKELQEQSDMQIPVQRNYKDTVFRSLFSKKERALSLYNGINGTDYQDASLIKYNTLENAIYMNMKNDLSFLFISQVYMWEHQSTIPVNIPLRDLLYASDLFQKSLVNRSIYSSIRLMIPTPHFVVFYNGVDDLPERMELKLSDSYTVPTEDPALELKVTVININPGMNEKLKEKCPELKEYVLYVEKVRSYVKDMSLPTAVGRAVDECIKENILREFLMEQKAEVIKMSIYEFDEEREMQLIRADEREIGWEKGRKEGREEGERIGREQGEKIGRAQGEKIGHTKGREETRKQISNLSKCLKADGRTEDIMRMLDDIEYQEQLLKEYAL